jgi:hypothetical protein
MSCGNSINCQTCSVTGGDITITHSAPQTATQGQFVTIPIIVTLNCYPGVTCLWVNAFQICLYDTDGACVADTGELSFAAWGLKGETVSTSVNYFQPSDKDFHGTLSVVQLGLFGAKTCMDSKLVSIKTIYPPAPVGKGYSCDSKINKCFADPQSTVSYAQCHVDCEGGTGTGAKPSVVCDPGSDMNIMGICVPKPVVLGAFALAAIYIFKS